MEKKHLMRIRRMLYKRSKPEFKKGIFRFFKEQINPIGVRLPMVRKLAKEFNDDFYKTHSFKEIMGLSKMLQSSDLFEEQIFGVYLIELHKREFDDLVFFEFEKWIDRYVSNWAHCDLFCTHSVMNCVEKNPKLLKTLLKWTKSKNRWVRRAACVTLILPARRGKFLPEILAIAGKLMYDPDPMVQKGTGWLLRECAKAHQEVVFEFLLKHKDAGRILLRYALEKFPKARRQKVLH